MGDGAAMWETDRRVTSCVFTLMPNRRRTPECITRSGSRLDADGGGGCHSVIPGHELEWGLTLAAHATCVRGPARGIRGRRY